MVRDGKVTERVLVCRESSAKWEPAWHVPGLFRAAGITEPGDSPPVALARSLSPSSGASGLPTLPGYVPPQARPPLLRLADVLRGAPAAAVGLLAVGFFYHWASEAARAFPLPPTEVEGEIIDCYFPLIGRCTSLECGLLYVDVFAVAAVATWHAVARKLDVTAATNP